MSGDQSDSDDAFDSAFAFRFRTFGEKAGNVVDAPEDYAESFDKEVGSAVAASLCDYLVSFAAENGQSVTFTRDGNEIEGERESGERISISCYAPELFDIKRSPSDEEVAANNFRIVFDIVNRLNADIMVYLARRFIINGHLDG